MASRYLTAEELRAQQAADTHAMLANTQMQAQAAQANMQYNAYMQAQQQANSSIYAYGGGCGTSIAPTWTTISGANPLSNVIPHNVYPATINTPVNQQFNPNSVTIAFTQANGMTITLDVDTSMVPALQAVSNYHANKCGIATATVYAAPTPKPVPMVDGDFSLDEIDQAEKIMEELSA